MKKKSATREAPAQEERDGAGVLAALKEPVEVVLKSGADKAQAGLYSLASQQKDRAAEGLQSVCDGLGRLGEHAPALGSYVESGQQSLEKLTHYLQDSELDELFDDAQNYARQHPTLVVGGLFAAGLIVGRFLRSSSTN